MPAARSPIMSRSNAALCNAVEGYVGHRTCASSQSACICSEVGENTNSMWQRWYGLEFDISGEAQLWDHLYAALEGGVMVPGRAYDIDVTVYDPNTIVQPIPKDKANLAWIIRLSTIFQF